MSGSNIRIYSLIAESLCDYLVIDDEYTRSINEYGVLDLARELKAPTVDSSSLRGPLLAICDNNLGRYEHICTTIYNWLILETPRALRIKEQNALDLADRLKIFQPIAKYASTRSGMFTLQETHHLCAMGSSSPRLIDALLANRGVIAERKV